MIKMQDLARRRAALTAAQRVLLDKRLKGEAPGVSAPVLIPRRSDPGPAPLSFPQQRLWFLDRLMPGNAFYNEQIALPIRFAVQGPILQRVLNAIVKRHEILRTTFVAMDGQPVQIVHPAADVTLKVLDWRAVAPAAQQSDIRHLAAEEVLRSFDLASGPLLRATLLRLGDGQALLLMTLHHIVCDGWSLNVLMRELGALYADFAAGRPGSLQELPLQYADFAVWQRQWLSGSILADLLAYWKRQLADLPMLQLPIDHPRPPIPTFQGAQEIFRLDPALTQGLKSLSRQRKTTLFMTLLAGFAVLLHRYTGQADIVVGMPVANRHGIRELEDLIGFFVNTLVLRIDLAGNPTFMELLERVRTVTVGAQEHQVLPFEKLVEELHPDRDLSRNPLCQVACQLLSLPGAAQPATAPVEADFMATSGTAKFDLRLDIGETADGLLGRLEYSTDLFRPDTVVRLAGHFQMLMAAAVADPNRRVGQLPLLTAAERQPIGQGFPAPRAGEPGEPCIHAVFEGWARQTPAAVAAVFEELSLTYGELNQRANQLAHYLQSLGVGLETRVGLAMQRCLEMVVGLLAIFKVGGVYTPLDPAYPAERLRLLIEDAGLDFIVSHQGLADAFCPPGITVVNLDRDSARIARHSRENPFSGVGPANLAYLIYTSGSTGKPKGALLEHRGLINVARAQAQVLGLDRNSRVLQFSALSFDASLFEIVMALHNGATLCLGPRERLLPGPPLIRLLRDQRITIVTLPPSALAVSPVAELLHLQTITVAGERCASDLVAKWQPGRRFINLYGPTEATIWSTYAECRDGETQPPIGTPIANTRAYVLDRYLNPVPVGVQGELYLAGAGLARGYLGRPDMTAERFLPDPFGPPGERMYRTGDRVHYRPDGSLAFIGRVDQQVKLRGYRIEPGEIEAVLARHPAVGAAAVVTGEGTGGMQLLAYAVIRQGESVTAGGLRDYLRERLPEFMVPSRLAILDHLPLTVSGKIDRHALPRPDAVQPDTAHPPPRTRVQQAIGDIWQALLQIEQVGLDDNFFDLGGHSLLLARLHSLLTERLGAELSMVDLFRYPTVRLLARRIGEETAGMHPDEGFKERAEKLKSARQLRRRRLEAGNP